MHLRRRNKQRLEDQLRARYLPSMAVRPDTAVAGDLDAAVADLAERFRLALEIPERAGTSISAGELYVILDREFRMRHSRECKSCYILLPYRVDSREDGDGNWEIIIPPDCPYGCSAILEELVESYSNVYELTSDSDERVR